MTGFGRPLGELPNKGEMAMLRRRCRSQGEAEILLHEISSARMILETSDSIEQLQAKTGLGVMKNDFAAFLQTLTGEEIRPPAVLRPDREAAAPGDTIAMQLNPIYREAIRVKLGEWEKEVLAKRESLLQFERAKLHTFPSRHSVSTGVI